ncbi:MAG TPA: alpha-L-fucosidase [Sedimentisphaerales bacterium]|nr:alpha-L-fucosidase [Sedimentisphaerales bacterium]
MNPSNSKLLKRAKNVIIGAALVCVPAVCGLAQATSTSAEGETAQQRDARMNWWREARFGMFIHWGLYAIPAGQWKGQDIRGIGEWIMNNAQIPVSEYEQLAGRFNPVKFNADQWVQIARNAGMKYIVITSKHHDGFCLWDSKVSEYDIMDATPFKRDVLKELSAACRKHGIKLCFYHSIMDWHHPDAQGPHYPTCNTKEKQNAKFPHYVENYLKPQIRELISGYGPLGVLWFDGQWIPEWNEDFGTDMYNFVRSLQSNIIINNRVSKGRRKPKDQPGKSYAVGDFGTPEQKIPAKGLPGEDWETCMTMNDTWGYKSSDHNWKSTEDLLRKLVDIASKGGNFLLNVGPTAEGLVPQPSVERLEALGKWLKVNGESIYATTANPIGQLAWGRCTTKANKLYLHVFDWPKDGRLVVPAVKNRTEEVYLLADREHKLSFTQEEDCTVVVSVPAEAPDLIDTVIVLKIKSA